MSKITLKVSKTVKKAIEDYGDEIFIIDRNQTQHKTSAIARRSVFATTLDASFHEYYFLLSADDFNRIRNEIGENISPPAFFGGECINYQNQTYQLRRTEPFDFYDGTRQVIRIWGTLKK